jgi:hypothetical protein
MKVSKLRLFSASLVVIMLVAVSLAIIPRNTAHAGSPDSNTTQSNEDKLTEENQKRLSVITPAPKLENSLERENLKKRLEFINDSNRLGYVYLLSLDGKVIAQYTIKGKVSSLNSFMTTTEQIRCRGTTTDTCGVLSSPDLDGSYGSNPEGIFFFTTEDAYVEWSGTYIYSSEKLNIQTPLSLTRNVE